MKTMIRGAVLSLALCALALTPSKAHAAFSVGVGFAAPAPVYVAPAPVYSTGGHYETRTTRVLVSGERHDRRWVATSYGNGYWQDVCIPPRYENQVTQIWVPDTTVVYERPYYGYGYRPGFGIGFGYSNYHRRW